MINWREPHSRKQTAFAILIALSLPGLTCAPDVAPDNSSLAGTIQSSLGNYAWPTRVSSRRLQLAKEQSDWSPTEKGRYGRSAVQGRVR